MIMRRRKQVASTGLRASDWSTTGSPSPPWETMATKSLPLARANSRNFAKQIALELDSVRKLGCSGSLIEFQSSHDAAVEWCAVKN